MRLTKTFPIAPHRPAVCTEMHQRKGSVDEDETILDEDEQEAIINELQAQSVSHELQFRFAPPASCSNPRNAVVCSRLFIVTSVVLGTLLLVLGSQFSEKSPLTVPATVKLHLMSSCLSFRLCRVFWLGLATWRKLCLWSSNHQYATPCSAYNGIPPHTPAAAVGPFSRI